MQTPAPASWLLSLPYLFALWYCYFVVAYSSCCCFILPFQRKAEVHKNNVIAYVALVLFVFGGGAYLVVHSFNGVAEEVMGYDYNIRTKQWDKAIAMADKDIPANPLSVASLNLALCQKGVMGDRMFHYMQNGTEGLLPMFDRDYLLPMMVGEIYYHLGLINTAQRFAFEGMEAIPDYKKVPDALSGLPRQIFY